MQIQRLGWRKYLCRKLDRVGQEECSHAHALLCHSLCRLQDVIFLATRYMYIPILLLA